MSNQAKPLSREAQSPRIAGLLLAGGRGSRFDPAGQADKLLAIWHGLPLAVHVARLLKSACDPCVAVMPPGKESLRSLLEAEGVIPVVSGNVLSGLSASVAVGVHAVCADAPPDAIVVALGDMPSIRESTLLAVLQAWRSRGGRDFAAAPFFSGKRGHPVVFGAAYFDILTSLSGDRGAAQILASSRLIPVEVDDPGVLHDIDTVEDLARMNELRDPIQSSG